jgi:hypothetical protein
MGKNSHRYHKMLTVEEMEKLSTPRLLNVLKIARALESDAQLSRGRRCCEMCKEYIGEDYEKDVAEPTRHLTNYKNRIKKILNTREHVD